MNKKVFCQGPFGLRMLEKSAKEIDTLWKAVDDECRKIGLRRVKMVDAGMRLEEGERADISLVTTDAIDRDNEVVLHKGLNWKVFKDNPAVMFAHQYNQPPIGRSVWLRRQDHDPTKAGAKGNASVNGWLAKTQYATKPDNWEGPWMPDAIWHLVKTGMLPGKSIGFIPLEVRSPSEKEILERPELAKISRIIAKAAVLEYSVAPVQSNPDALAVSIAKCTELGVKLPDWILDEFGVELPEKPITIATDADFDLSGFYDRPAAKAPKRPEFKVIRGPLPKAKAPLPTAKEIGELVRKTVEDAIAVDRGRV